MDLTIDYYARMLNQYPEVLKQILEFRALTKTQSVQFEDVHEELTKLLDNAYIVTGDEATLSKWEKLLNIIPLPQGEDDFETWLSDRRDTIIARLFSVEKLNSKTISEIVKIFTGGVARSYFKDGTIHVLISPPEKQYKFDNVEQELRNKIPAHLELSVAPNYRSWEDLKNNNSTWQDVKNNYNTWEDVLFIINI